MKSALRFLLAMSLSTVLLLGPRDAFADEAGIEDAAVDVSDAKVGDGEAGGAQEDASASGTSDVPLACDGSLCDTTNGAMCGVSHDGPPNAPIGSMSAAVFLLALALVGRRSHPRKERRR